ncbi:MAG TPA: hypothetical protein VN961_24825, partial [Streptosporangiaceae bacterium]|nr:hypothetical protein [Streptosporangiaceae bacterium]
RCENELHRQRFTEVWNWWHSQQDGPQATEAVRWYYAWTGARPPLDPGADGPLPPGIGCRDADEAYERYVGSLEAQYEPGRLGRPRPMLARAASKSPSGRWRLQRRHGAI